MSQQLRVAYLVSRYPAVSHTFIQREVAALEDLGVEVHPFSVRRAAATDALSETDRRALAATTALLPAGRSTLGRALFDAARHPRATGRTLRYAVRRGHGHPRATLWQLFYLVEAILLWRQLRSRGLRHVHAHFANVAADVARLACRFGREVDGGRWTWSFTMHGPTEFSDVVGFDLAAKVVDADRVMCISDYCRSQLMALVAEEHWAKLVIIHCGIEPEVFVPADRGDRCPSTLHILCVGRLVPEKGQAVLLEALPGLVGEGIDVRATFVGSGPDSQALEAAAASLGLAHRVRFTGPVGQDVIRAHYDAADVFCLPSFAEGVPVVLMEAMACGLPVVTTRITGVPELVEDGLAGVLVSPGRADLLAGALARLARDPATREAMGRTGRQAVLERYDAADAARELADRFSELAGPGVSS